MSHLKYIKLSEAKQRLGCSLNLLLKFTRMIEVKKYFVKINNEWHCDYDGLVNYLRNH